MALPLSERAIRAVIERLRGIRTAAGYHTDAGLRVYRARQSLGEAELPAVVVWDNGEQPGGETGSGSHQSMRMTQQIAVEIHAAAEQADTGEVLGLLKADAKRAVLRQNALIDSTGAIGLITYIGAQPLPRPDGASSEAVRVEFAAAYKEAFGDPSNTV